MWRQPKPSATIRVVHLPTGITTVCESERSQHRNKAKALVMLRSKLYALREGLIPAQHTSLTSIATYELDDAEPYPDELSKYKEQTK